MFYLLYHPPSLILFFNVHVLYILGFFSLVNSAIRYYFLGSVTLVSPLPILPPASPVILNIQFPCRSMKINTTLILDEKGGGVFVWRSQRWWPGGRWFIDSAGQRGGGWRKVLGEGFYCVWIFPSRRNVAHKCCFGGGSRGGGDWGAARGSPAVPPRSLRLPCCPGSPCWEGGRMEKTQPLCNSLFDGPCCLKCCSPRAFSFPSPAPPVAWEQTSAGGWKSAPSPLALSNWLNSGRLCSNRMLQLLFLSLHMTKLPSIKKLNKIAGSLIWWKEASNKIGIKNQHLLFQLKLEEHRTHGGSEKCVVLCIKILVMLPQGDCNSLLVPLSNMASYLTPPLTQTCIKEPPGPLIERVRSCIFPMQVSMSEGGFSVQFKSKNGPYPLEAFGPRMILKVSVKSMACSPGIPEGLLLQPHQYQKNSSWLMLWWLE